MLVWQAFVDGLSVLSEKWMVITGTVSIVALGCSLSFFLSQNSLKAKGIAWQSSLLPVLFFITSAILRLAFVAESFVPPYFDSAEHYTITQKLVTALETSTLLETVPTLTPAYYHLGFHCLASFLTMSLHANPMDVILVLGQVILAALPIPIYFLVRDETKSDAAAFFSMLLAGFGWYMPGFAVNWGKYPALAGLLALEIVLGIAYFTAKLNRRRGKYPERVRRREQMFVLCLLTLGILISMLFHTRTLVVLAISFVSWFIAGKLQISLLSLQDKPAPKQFLLPGIIIIGLVVFGVFARREILLNLTLEPYLGAGLWVTLTVLGLSLFALTGFPHAAYLSLFFTFLVLAVLFVPVPAWFPPLANQTLLDRPFAEMLLYLPLSILGGLGLAGMLNVLCRNNTWPAKIPSYAKDLILLSSVGFAGFFLTMRYDFYPSDCCNFMKYDDTIAFDWLDKNLPPDARILIAATQLNVLSSGPSAGLAGTDAGIWIPAFTGRTITMTQFDTDFRSGSTLEQLCQMQVGYIYIGNTAQKFDGAQLQAKENWYKAVLFLPNAQLYQLTGCSR